ADADAVREDGGRDSSEGDHSMHVRASGRSLRLGRLTRSAAATATLLICAASAHAQAAPDSASIPLDTLRVPVTRSLMSADRAPVSLSLVRRAAIQDGRATVGLTRRSHRCP